MPSIRILKTSIKVSVRVPPTCTHACDIEYPSTTARLDVYVPIVVPSISDFHHHQMLGERENSCEPARALLRVLFSTIHSPKPHILNILHNRKAHSQYKNKTTSHRASVCACACSSNVKHCKNADATGYPTASSAPRIATFRTQPVQVECWVTCHCKWGLFIFVCPHGRCWWWCRSTQLRVTNQLCKMFRETSCVHRAHCHTI